MDLVAVGNLLAKSHKSVTYEWFRGFVSASIGSTTQTRFETLNVHGIPDCLVCFGTTDIVMDSGDGASHARDATFAWLATVPQSISWSISMTEGTLLLPPQSVRLLWLSQRNTFGVNHGT